MKRPARVLLVSMPFSSPHFPSLGLGLLKPALVAQGVACDVRYFSLDYAERLGGDAHDQLTDPAYYMAHAGEWVFAGVANDSADGSELDFFSEYFAGAYPEHYAPALLMALLEAREGAGAFIDSCLDAIDGEVYGIVGFTSAFQQNMASLALARRLKARYPRLAIVFGGTNCQGEMGIERLRQYPFIDAVCLGEGDLVFPDYVRRRLAGEACAGMDGMAVREGGRLVVPGRMTVAVTDMDSLPYPDFGDFFEQHARMKVAAELYPPAAVFETSRGCWWGAKHHCAFCGLNALTLAYRSKSQRRAYDELAWLVARHGPDLANADTILDPRYFDEFIPRLAEQGPKVTIYYELKANLKPGQMALLGRAGIRKIQPGLESLDSAILKLIDKGCTMLQNVQTLKLAAEAGVYVEWLALYGVPGETAEQYQAMAAIIPKLRHLQPPSAIVRVRADRFSPYFHRPAQHGVRLEPAPPYRFLYPFDGPALERIAYHFDMRSPELDRAGHYAAPALDQYRQWQARKDASALYGEPDGEGMRVVDRRTARRKVWQLGGADAALLAICHRIVPRHVIEAQVASRFGADETMAARDRLLARGLLLQEGEGFLSLVLRQPGYRRAPSWEEVRAETVVPYLLQEPHMAAQGRRPAYAEA